MGNQNRHDKCGKRVKTYSCTKLQYVENAFATRRLPPRRAIAAGVRQVDSYPQLVAQVHHDSITRPEDVQSIYDAISIEEKKLVWIEGITRRFDGYNYFGAHPEVAIDWFNSATLLSPPWVNPSNR